MPEPMNIRACLREGHPVTYKGEHAYIHEILSFTQAEIISANRTVMSVVQIDDLVVGWSVSNA